MQCQYCHFRFTVAGYYGHHLRVQHPNKPVASGATMPAADVPELAGAKGSRSQSIAVAVSAKRPKTEIQRAPAIGQTSLQVSFPCENVCGNVEDPQERVADAGEVQKTTDCPAIQAREQPAYLKQSALVS